MTESKLKEIWLNHYSDSPSQLNKVKHVNGLISAFNANIDAVIKLSGSKIQELIDVTGMNSADFESTEHNIKSREDVVRGLIHCFKNGIAEEWLVDNIETYKWIDQNIGYDKMQMGGQGGIVANVAAICGVNPVYVHCASLPQEQAELFLDLENLLSIDQNGNIKQANLIHKEEDIPLIHYILEFDTGDSITINEQTFTCPKSNRFIATFDPLNFKLHIDDTFLSRISEKDIEYQHIILSGYQMLQETISTKMKGKDRIDESLNMLSQLKKNKPDCIIHFEVASTQDRVIRKYLIDKIASKVDSIGFNERELIDILEVIGEEKLATVCDNDTTSVNLFKGMLKVQEYTSCPRLQLHMFGLYITLQSKEYKISPLQNRKGMQLAASVAASKAGTGNLNTFENLKWAFGKEVSGIGLNELESLQNYIKTIFGKNELLEKGIFEGNRFDIAAVPTILIDKPVTLVGMGDTISSVSLIAAF